MVQIRKPLQDGGLEGSVEEVDTGKQAKFLSENELIEFLQECLAQIRLRREVKGMNE